MSDFSLDKFPEICFDQPMLVSVVLPTYNRRELVVRAIQSVLRQSRPVDEILVVDDASSDGTVRDLQDIFSNELQSGRLRILENAENLGVSASRNRGVLASKGEWVAFLDSDDEWLPRKIERQLLLADDFLWIHGQEKWLSDGLELNQLKKHAKAGGDIFDDALKLCVVSPSTVMIHRSLFERHGMFDVLLPVCEDYDLWLRLAAEHPIGFVNEVLIVKYGGHQDQLSRRFHSMDYWRFIALKKQTTNPVHSSERCQRIWQEIGRKSSILLRGYTRHRNFENYSEVFQGRQMAFRHLGQIQSCL